MSCPASSDNALFRMHWKHRPAHSHLEQNYG
jgi:hypothetical protein